MYDTIRLTSLRGCQRKFGCDVREASLANLAMHSLDSAHRPVERRLEKDLRRMSRRFARASRQARDATELRELSYIVLGMYAYMARACGDPYYHPLFESATLEAQVDLDEERLEQLRALLDKVAESRVIMDEYGSVADFLVAHGYGPDGKKLRGKGGRD